MGVPDPELVEQAKRRSFTARYKLEILARGHTMLMPPDLTDWVPDDHVVWSILGAVEQLDLSAFYGAYRENGQGRAAYEPSMKA